MTRMSVSCSSRCVAKLCRSVCGDTRFLIPAVSAAAWTARLRWRVEKARADCGRETASRAAGARPGAGLLATRHAAVRAAAVTALPGGLYGPPLSRGQAFALLDPQQHALGVDIADLERDDLGDAQPGAPGLRRGRLRRWRMPPCTSAPAPPGAAA